MKLVFNPFTGSMDWVSVEVETDPIFTAWLATSPLAGYVPHTGATGNVLLGAFALVAGTVSADNGLAAMALTPYDLQSVGNVQLSPGSGIVFLEDLSGEMDVGIEFDSYAFGDGATLYYKHLTAQFELNKKLVAPNYTSSVATGTQPYAATSTTVNTNLNADLLDGNHAAAFATAGHNHDSSYLAPTSYSTYTPAAGATVTLDARIRDHWITLPTSGTVTLAVSNAALGLKFFTHITNPASGSCTLAWFTTIRWAGATVPTRTATVNKRDKFEFDCTAANTYDGSSVGFNY